MSGVIAALRRTLLSCTSLARGGVATLGTMVGASGLDLARPAHAADLSFLHTLVGMNHQEFAALTTALSLLGFSVVAAILLMRTRLRAARNETGLRSDIQRLQSEADRYRSLLFAEPQVLIAWPAGEDRPEISGDVSSLTSQELSQRILAFGTWLPAGPALQMDRAIDTLRESGEGFLLNLNASNGIPVEVIGRAIGGQAIVRIRELSGVRRELAETHLRHSALLQETEMLRGFAQSAPWPIGPKQADGRLQYANAAYAKAADATSFHDAIERNVQLLDSSDRTDMDRALQETSSFAARLPIVVG